MEMGLIEKVWFLITFSIISIILITDPKDPVATSSTTPIATLFSSASKGQKFITRLNWVLILLFFILTTVLSYLA